MKFKTFIKDKKYIWKILIIMALVLVDLATKVYFANYFESGNSNINLLGGLITLTYVRNTGAAFGVLANNTIFLAIISAIFVIAFTLIDVYQKRQDWLYAVAYSIMMAGALGNLVDRLFLNYVRDFIKFSMFGFVCNWADICICVGVTLYLLSLIINVVKESKKDKIDEK